MSEAMMEIDWKKIPTPCYVIDQRLLERNIQRLDEIQRVTGCKILLAQKGFAMFAVYPMLGQVLKGTTASSLHEARLGHEEMGGEVHIFSPAYDQNEFQEITKICDHIVFNSFAQWKRFKPEILSTNRHISCGMRINPEYSEIETNIYNPCYAHSRLGVTLSHFEPQHLDGIEGLHFHTMCEQNADTLERTLDVVEKKFGTWIEQMKWVNFGGGHHITRSDYDVDCLIYCISRIQDKYGVQVYLEPGEAVALNTGFLAARVLDIMENGMEIAILDTSAACHMPDVLEMPYRPEVIGSGQPNQYQYTYRLTGPSCLAGDVIGDYSFPQPLKNGDRVIFCDMAHYTMVKNNTFNGIQLPSIGLFSRNGFQMVKEFGYEDFKSRLS